MPNTNLIDYRELEGLTDAEKEAVLQILGEVSMSGSSSFLSELKYADFEEVPVSIHEFLHNREYLGNALYDPEGRFTVYPYWEQKLKEIFPTPTETAYNTVVLTGAIGLGKTFIAVICLLYMLYRLLCLKDPYLYYGMQPIDKLSISLMNITLENAKGVALDKMNQLIMASPWFMAHGEMAGTVNLEYRPNKHIEIITASSNNQIIGRAIFCLGGDTLIETSKGIFKLKELLDKNIKVKTLNQNTGKIEISQSCKVLPTICTNDFYEIELENGSIIKCTPEHKFLLKNGQYKMAKDLTEKDEFYEII